MTQVVLFLECSTPGEQQSTSTSSQNQLRSRSLGICNAQGGLRAQINLFGRPFMKSGVELKAAEESKVEAHVLRELRTLVVGAKQ
jgi:hypothetical protein